MFLLCRVLIGYVFISAVFGQELDTTRYEKLNILVGSRNIPNTAFATDGDTSTCISYSKSKGNARVWIILRGTANVHRVIIRHSGKVSNSELKLMKNVKVKVSATSSSIGVPFCFHNLDDILADEAIDTTHLCTLYQARSVFIIRKQKIQFCEVEVYGCVSGHWGKECDKQCGHCASDVACDSLTGKCDGGCKDEWKGELCDIAPSTTTTTTTTEPATTQPTSTTATELTTTVTSQPSTTTSTTTTESVTTQPTTIDSSSTVQPVTAKTKLTTTNSGNPQPTSDTTEPDITTAIRDTTTTNAYITEPTTTVASSIIAEYVTKDATQQSSLTTTTISSTVQPTTTANDHIIYTPRETSAGYISVNYNTTEDITGKDSDETNVTLLNSRTFTTVTTLLTNDDSESNNDTNYGVSTEPIPNEQTANISIVTVHVTTGHDLVTDNHAAGGIPPTDSSGFVSTTETVHKESEQTTEIHQESVTSDINSGNGPSTRSEVLGRSSAVYSTTSNTMNFSGTATSVSPWSESKNQNESGIDGKGNNEVSTTTYDVKTSRVTVLPSAVLTSTKTQEVIDPKKGGSVHTECEGFQCSRMNVGIAVAAILFLLLTGVLIYVIYRRQVKKKTNHDLEKVTSNNGFNGIPLPNITAATKATGSSDNLNFTNETDDPDEASSSESDKLLTGGCNLSSFSPTKYKNVKINDIYQHVTLMTERSLFYKDFMSLPGADISPCKIGRENSLKNRYANMSTFDHSRVILEKSNVTVDDTDYINASYIDSFDQPKAYIATQGPLESTVDDFWKMIWQEKSQKIIMLTELEENEKMKCFKYWPSKNERMSVASFTITMENEFHFPIYSLRQFNVVNNQTQQARAISQFQFKVWPDHGVPDVFPLLLFHNRVSTSHQDNQEEPVIVHCSAGVGRTGTFIALDALCEQGKKTGYVTIHMFVEYMRKCRPCMVQTLDQYVFLHTALLEMFVCPGSLVEADNLQDAWNKSHYQEQALRIAEEYKKLKLTCPKYGEETYSAALLQCNRNKNGTTVLPVDAYRVTLQRTKSNNDYINAIVLPSLSNKPDYLVTEMPLSTTTESFWRMIYEQSSNAVVFLDHPLNEKGISVISEPDEELTIGPFLVRHTGKIAALSHDIRGDTYSIEYENKEKSVAVFRAPQWETGQLLPATSASLISLHQEVQKWQEGREQAFVTVVCRDGAERCGLYCASCNVMDCIDWYNQVDIYHIIRQLQNRRPEIISSEMQYSYCFDVAVTYTDTSDGTCIQLPDDTMIVVPMTTV